MRAFIAFITFINRIFFKFAALLLFLLILLTVQQVVSRYIFNSSSVALQELQWHLFGFIICLSFAYTLDRDAHVRVDILNERFPQTIKKTIHIVGFILLIPLCLTLAYFGLNDVFTARSFGSGEATNFFLIGESSPDPGGLPARWIIRAAFPLGMLLLALQSLVLLLRTCFSSLNDTQEYRWL